MIRKDELFMLNVKFLRDTAKMPTAANLGSDLGYDVFSAETVTIHPGTQELIGTGIAVEAKFGSFGNFGFVVKDRSSMAMKRLYTHAGVIDAGYRGEVKILLENASNTPYTVRIGDKVAQLIPCPVYTLMIPHEVSELSDTTRGIGGFGSTGR